MPRTRQSFCVALSLVFTLCGTVLAQKKDAIPDAQDKSPEAETKEPPDFKPVETRTKEEMETDAVPDGDAVESMRVPVVWFQKASNTERLRYEKEFRALLALGLSERSSAVEDAHKRFEAGRQVCGTDPRLFYAYGLALLHHKKYTTAAEQFQAATKRSGGAFLLGSQAAAWVYLTRNDIAHALPLLKDVATGVERTSESWPTERVKLQVSEWLGIAFGFLRNSETIPRDAQAIEQTESEVVALLKAEHRVAYDRARTEVVKRIELVRSQAARPAGELRQDTETTLKKLAVELEEAEQRVKDKQAEFDELNDEWKQAHADYDFARRTANRLLKAVTDSQTQIRRLSNPWKFTEKIPVTETDSKGRIKTEIKEVSRPENATERSRRLDQIAATEDRKSTLAKEYNEARPREKEAKDNLDKTKLRLTPPLTERLAAVTEQQREVGMLNQKIKLLTDDPPTPESLRAKVNSLATFMPLQPMIEKQRLLASLRPPATGAAKSR
ncbi:MAG: hypothetical protein HZA46_19150 [Planctomycetales bacterium]|nr:hypothetical protein [Planctomycetales bacterium]